MPTSPFTCSSFRPRLVNRLPAGHGCGPTLKHPPTATPLLCRSTLHMAQARRQASLGGAAAVAAGAGCRQGLSALGNKLWAGRGRRIELLPWVPQRRSGRGWSACGRMAARSQLRVPPTALPMQACRDSLCSFSLAPACSLYSPTRQLAVDLPRLNCQNAPPLLLRTLLNACATVGTTYWAS